MTNDQEIMWKVLANDAEFLCHKWAKELLALKGRKFDKLADHYLNYITNNFGNEQALRIVKTWLSHYELPLDPSKLSSFDNFHLKYGLYIRDNIQDIKEFR